MDGLESSARASGRNGRRSATDFDSLLRVQEQAQLTIFELCNHILVLQVPAQEKRHYQRRARQEREGEGK